MAHVITFDDWIQHIFDRPLRKRLTDAWWWDDDAAEWDLKPSQAVEYLTRLFENSVDSLKNFSDEQIGHGLWAIAGASFIETIHHLFMPSEVEWEDRKRCFSAMYNLFEDLFALRCRRLRNEEQSELEAVCYMWWDLLPTWGEPKKPSHREQDQMCLWVMKRILRIKSNSCVESALHRLGHWQMHYPEFVYTAISELGCSKRGLPPELSEYAGDAIVGYVQ